jgi:hypothetical protein
MAVVNRPADFGRFGVVISQGMRKKWAIFTFCSRFPPLGFNCEAGSSDRPPSNPARVADSCDVAGTNGVISE